MNKGNWARIYTKQGKVEIQVLDMAIEARDLFLQKGYRYVLDLGCGIGMNTLMLADAGFNVKACDTSEYGLSMTRRLVHEAGFDNVSYSIQKGDNLRVEENRYEAILSLWMQEDGRHKVMRQDVDEVYRVLKKGGTFFTDLVIDDEEEHTLKDLFSSFNQTRIEYKSYRFHDSQGNEQKVKAAVVIGIK